MVVWTTIRLYCTAPLCEDSYGCTVWSSYAFCYMESTIVHCAKLGVCKQKAHEDVPNAAMTCHHKPELLGHVPGKSKRRWYASLSSCTSQGGRTASAPRSAPRPLAPNRPGWRNPCQAGAIISSNMRSTLLSIWCRDRSPGNQGLSRSVTVHSTQSHCTV